MNKEPAFTKATVDEARNNECLIFHLLATKF